MHKLARDILALLSEGLGKNAELLSSKFGGELKAATVQTGLNYYPQCPQPELVMGASGHADVSVVTILQQSDVSGLEVLKEDSWVPVPPLPRHAFVVNVGDILQASSLLPFLLVCLWCRMCRNLFLKLYYWKTCPISCNYATLRGIGHLYSKLCVEGV